MKLNIEELAKQASDIADKDARFGDWSIVRDEAFARLIVERCARSCDELAELNRKATTDSMWQQGECAAAIRKLLEE